MQTPNEIVNDAVKAGQNEVEKAVADIKAFALKVESGAVKLDGDARRALFRAADSVRDHL